MLFSKYKSLYEVQCTEPKFGTITHKMIKANSIDEAEKRFKRKFPNHILIKVITRK